MSIVDASTLDYADIDGFWIHKEKKRPIRAIMGLANVDCSRIFATGMDGSQQVLIYWKSGSEKINRNVTSDFVGNLTVWTCCESSLSDDHFYIGGMNIDMPTIGAVNLNESLSPISFYKFSKAKSKSLSKIKRVEGTDMIMVGLI